MRLRNVFGILLSLFALVIVGCGGGSSSTPVSTTVSGQAQKGPIIGGNVQIFAIDATGTVQSTPLATSPATVTTRAPFGNYSAVIGYAGPAKVVVTGNVGSTYHDEATSTEVSFAGKSLSAVVANVTGNVKVAVTPFTEMAVQAAGTTLTPAKITLANTGVANALGLKGTDIISVSPSTSSAYRFALSVISQAAGTTATGLSNLLATTAAAIDTTNGAITSPTVSAAITTANIDAFSNPNIDHTGIVASDIAGVAFVATPTAGAINAQVALNATVKRVDGAASVGTTVNFLITSGTGTLSAASAVTDASGIATVNLTKNSEGNVGVSASAGNFAGSLTVTFTDPNKPGSIILTAPASSFLNSPVTLTATVAPASTSGTLAVGTPVTFTILTGTGTISAVTTTNASGVATATLTSGVVGIVNVNATAGIAPAVVTSNTVPVSFLTNPNLPGAITISPSTSSLFIGQGPVTITATVSPAGQGGVIPDGTVVTFLTTAGTLTSPTATTGGVATVSLDSTVVATAAVTARVAGITSSAVNVQFNDPNSPSAITLTAPSTGATNSPVTLTATVAAAGGQAFTVPNGTVVTFTITSGTGTLTAATATTTNGVATTSLTSAVVGAVTVNAKAGTAPVVTSTPDTSVSFVALVTKAILKLNTTGSLPTGVSIGAWDADIQFPASVTINNGTLGALAAPAFALSGTDSSVALPAGNGNATSNAADVTHVRPFVSAAFFISGTGITTIGEIATFTFDLVTPTATPALLATDFVLNPTNVNSSAVGAPPLKPGTDIGVTLTFQ